MDKLKPKLKPCPFCGSKDVEVFEPDNKETTVGRAVICNNCDTRVGFPTAFDELIAMDLWNRRADNDKV